jgi:hypothetical protein
MCCSEDIDGSFPAVRFSLLSYSAANGLINYLRSVDTDRDGWVQINYEQFMSVNTTPPPRRHLFTEIVHLDRAECTLVAR